MPRRGRYYLGRVHRIGVNFTDEILRGAITEPKTVIVGEHGWTVTSGSHLTDPLGRPYVFGNLTKFKPKGEISVVDTLNHKEVERSEQNLSVAKSPFVYLPEFSGIAYLHVWNEIDKVTFVHRFEAVIHATLGQFFQECEIQPVSDVRTFVQKVSELESIEEIEARVKPPNPLFSPLWKSLEEYLKRRRAEEVNIREKALPAQSLQTRIVEIVSRVVDDEGPRVANEEQVEIGDAALLMAADGYGTGKVTGTTHSVKRVIKTSETLETFLLKKTPSAAELYDAARQRFESINRARGLSH